MIFSVGRVVLFNNLKITCSPKLARQSQFAFKRQNWVELVRQTVSSSIFAPRKSATIRKNEYLYSLTLDILVYQVRTLNAQPLLVDGQYCSEYCVSCCKYLVGGDFNCKFITTSMIDLILLVVRV